MLNKPRKAFIVIVLWHILSIKGKINFLQLGRFGPLTEQTYRKQFEKTFDFLGFNMDLIKQVVSNEAVVALDPSYIPKSGKSTFGLGRFWSVVADSVKIGLDICGFAVVDVVNNTALHLKAWQTPSAGELLEKGLNLLSHYASLVTERMRNSLKRSQNILWQMPIFPNGPLSKLKFQRACISLAV